MSVTEDYCSFEVAKLLKEKGFDEPTETIIYPNNNIVFVDTNSISRIPHQKLRNSENNIYDNGICCPTHQMALKWLREIHNLSVEVYRTACGYIGCIVAIPSGTDIKFLEDDGDDLPSGQYTTFEKACEAAIKYCLTNLI